MLSDRQSRENLPVPPQPPGLKWAVRIFVTIFTLPFFAVGLTMIGGGSILGTQGGPSGAFGWFGVLFGLAFIAVPSLMLFTIWSSWGKKPEIPQGETSIETAPDFHKNGDAREVPAIPAMQMCTYCGRPRPIGEPTCPACGAH